MGKRLAFSLAAMITVVGMVALYYLQKTGLHHYHEVGLWLGLVCFNLLMATLCTGAPSGWKWKGWGLDWVYVGLLLAVAAFTLSWRLAEVPDIAAYDYPFFISNLIDWMAGCRESFWAYCRIAVIPMVGLALPHSIGLALFGPTPLGFRFGGVIMGMSAVVSLYYLGKLYYDRRVGLLAGIFLAGSMPFMYFSRLPYTIDSTAFPTLALTFFAYAWYKRSSNCWLLCGLAAGCCFYKHGSARVAPLIIFIGYICLAVRSPRIALRQWHGPVLLAVGAALMVTPYFYLWRKNPSVYLAPRSESVQVLNRDLSVKYDVLWEQTAAKSTGALRWLFLDFDGNKARAEWSTLLPVCNNAEAVLLAVGFGSALLGGFGLNTLLLLYALAVLIICGVWSNCIAECRLLPCVPIMAVLMARSSVGLYELLWNVSKRVRHIVWIILIAIVIWLSPWNNWQQFEANETGPQGREQTWATNVGRKIEELGAGYEYFLVANGYLRWEWKDIYLCELYPYIYNKRIRQLYNVADGVDSGVDGPAVFILNTLTADRCQAVLLKAYPNARIESLVERKTKKELARLIIVNKPGTQSVAPIVPGEGSRDR